MKKRFFVLLLSLFATLAVFSEGTQLPRLAVVEFTVNDTQNSKLVNDAVAVRNQVQSSFIKTGRYDVIARDEIDKLLENQQIAVSSISDRANLKKLNIYQIAYLVTGSVNVLDDKYLVTISMLDVSNGRFVYSDDLLMETSPTDIFQSTSRLVSNFMANLKISSSEIVSESVIKNSTTKGGIGIHVETGSSGGILYIYENYGWKELAILWDNDSYDIPINKPGIYSIKILYPDGNELRRDVNVNSREIYIVSFAITIGSTGPGGGTVFMIKGKTAYEYSEILGCTNWNDAQRLCTNYRGGGYSDWYLPNGDEFFSINRAVWKIKRMFNDDEYWTAEYTNWIGLAGADFRNAVPLNYLGSRDYYNNYGNGEYYKYSFFVRAVRVFEY